jgi:hypothetical protein
MSWIGEDEVKALAKAYNKEHPSKPKIKEGSVDEMWDDLQKRFHDDCVAGNAECIIAKLLSAHRPKAPKSWNVKRDEWLSSDDIDHVEKNYMELFPDYFFVGCVPIDFDLKSETGQCIVSALCSLNLKELEKKGKHRVGVVFNTDPHDGPGEHWIAVFADLRPELEYARITYFDSYAHEPEKEIKILMRRWKEEWDKVKTNPGDTELASNKTRHQFKDSECGMYCLYFHYASLVGIPMEETMPDEVMSTFRNFLFRIPKQK